MSSATPSALAPLLTPKGHLCLIADADAAPLPEALAERLASSFSQGGGHGLFQLGAREVGCALPPALGWWRDFAARYVTALCAIPEGEAIHIAPPDPPTLTAWVADVSPMTGAATCTQSSPRSSPRSRSSRPSRSTVKGG